MDRLEAMSVFMTVVEAGSFSETSRRLDMPIATPDGWQATFRSVMGSRHPAHYEVIDRLLRGETNTSEMLGLGKSDLELPRQLMQDWADLLPEGTRLDTFL
jgi:hypothetical protein